MSGTRVDDLQKHRRLWQQYQSCAGGRLVFRVKPRHRERRTIIRPYLGYGDLNQATNNLYSNYNAIPVDLGAPGEHGHYSVELHARQSHLGLTRWRRRDNARCH